MEPWPFPREQVGKWDICNVQSPPDYSTCIKQDLPPPHDTAAKKLLLGVVQPAGKSPQEDMDAALDNLFNHPNVGPFISRQLIQRLTQSHPAPAYVARVARVFNDNGSGIRGDMKSVIRAILLDNEARQDTRSEDPLAGKLKEPMLRFTQVLRALNAKPSSGIYLLPTFSEADTLNQAPLHAPSVFNFYRPDFQLPGQPAGSVVNAPEFQIATSSAIAGWTDFSNCCVVRGYGVWLQGSADEKYYVKPNYGTWPTTIRSNVAQVIDELNVLLLNGKMEPDFRTRLIDSVSKVPIDEYTPVEERIQIALWQIINSPAFLVQR
jgi:hypothetical protein